MKPTNQKQMANGLMKSAWLIEVYNIFKLLKNILCLGQGSLHMEEVKTNKVGR